MNKYSLAKRGKHNPMFGKHHSLKTIKKISKTKIGPNNSSWKGGITPINILARSSRRIKNLRLRVFRRDKFSCAICECTGGVLNMHHIKEWAKYPKLRYIEKNLITLCYECHRRVHMNC